MCVIKTSKKVSYQTIGFSIPSPPVDIEFNFNPNNIVPIHEHYPHLKCPHNLVLDIRHLYICYDMFDNYSQTGTHTHT